MDKQSFLDMSLPSCGCLRALFFIRQLSVHLFFLKLLSSTQTQITLPFPSTCVKYFGGYSLNFTLEELPEWIKIICLKRAS